MSIAYIVQMSLNASVVCALYGLLAVAYVLVHGITRRVNLAFGALSVWAGYLAIDSVTGLMIRNPALELLPLAGGIAIAILGTVALGMAIERTVVRPLVHASSLGMLVATLGLAIVLEEGMRLLHASSESWLIPILKEPIVLDAEAGLQTSPMQLGLVVASLTLAAMLILGVRRLPFGRRWRAVSQDPAMAELCGIDVGRTLAATFVLASLYAGAAGALSAVHYGQASYYSCLMIGLKTLFIAVVGGLDSVAGAFLAAMLVGIAETFWSGYMSEEHRDVLSLLALSWLMILFPSGLMAGSAARQQQP